jgi:predicted ester cyclase
MSEHLIRQYYAYFNQRRVKDAATLFADDATFDHPPFANTAYGGSGYMHFAETWLRAFPDAQLRIDHVNQRSAGIYEIDLVATGTHSGMLDLGPYGRLSPSGGKTTFRIREMLHVQEGKIVHSSLSFDIHDLLYQLAHIDYAELDAHLGEILQLRDELGQVGDDPERHRRVIERMGRELDAARIVVRPWFHR